MKPFDVITVVWGREYSQVFVDVCVPNQATPGNLGALPPGSRYRVFTAAADVEFLQSNLALQQVNALLSVDIVAVPELSGTDGTTFTRMTACHMRALTDAREVGAAVIFLAPDHFMSEGTLAAVARRHRAGARAVVCPGIRLDREGLIDALHAQGDARNLSPRQLVAVALPNLHPFTKGHIVDNQVTVEDPISVYWKVGDEGLIARCFYLHPLMVDPVLPDVMPDGTIDQHYIFRSCPDRAQVHVVDDSDELVVFEMSHVDGAPRATAPGVITVWTAASVLCRCDPHQQSYWRVPIRFHVQGIGDAWRGVEAASERFSARTRMLRPLALWQYRTSRRMRPYWREAKQVRKDLRDTWKDLAPDRLGRSVARRTRPLQKLQQAATRSGRHALRNARRSLLIGMHSTARPFHKLRKRATRAGRRLLQRVRLAH